MKKSLMVLAASGALLFAACEKGSEKSYVIDGKDITFSLSMDTPKEDGKQSFNGSMKRSFFTDDDQIYINGTVCDVNPIATGEMGTNASWSSIARATAPVSEDGRYSMVYPVSYMALTDAGYGTTFPSSVMALNGGVPRNDIATMGTSDYAAPAVPLYYHTDDVTQVRDGFMLKNTCSFFSPTVLYGPVWANIAFGPIAGVQFGDSVAAPSLHVTGGSFMTNFPLSGDAVLNSTVSDNPVMEIVENGNAKNYVKFQCSDNTMVADNSNQVSGQEVQNITGMVVVPAQEWIGTKNVSMTMTFDVEINGNTYYCHFVTFPKNARMGIMRSTRYFVNLNLQTLSLEGLGGRFSYLNGSAEDYVAAVSQPGQAGRVEFENGTLYVYDNYSDLDAAWNVMLQAGIE